MSLTPALFLQPLLAQPVAILGGGVSGEGVKMLLTALGGTGTVYDAKGADFTAKAASGHRLAVFSPGFAPGHPWLARARTAGLECLAELDFASLGWKGQVVAITGTNGKTTLTEFLTHALRSIGRAACATGNIGYSFSQLVAESAGGSKDTYALCEVSSFQAETLRHFEADATLWTNFAEDHLERHLGMEAYFAAKWNLVARTLPGGLLAGSSVGRFARKYDRPLAAASAVATEGQPKDARLTGTVFADYPQRENFLLAAAWWQAAGFDEGALCTAAKTFRLGRHRLVCVAEYEGVGYWNDSKATNFHAVEAALTRFPGSVILIAGGKSKGGDLAGFVHRIAARVKHAMLIGETSAELAFHSSAFRVSHTSCATLDEAVRRAAELAVPGDQVLLSPGFSSLDQFRNYEDRGEQFERLARELSAETNLR
ncbi:MAG: UDP-N-acetylmuramoyl-L-alanine--D-glutamate ligase [Opitutaceae bacterium]